MSKFKDNWKAFQEYNRDSWDSLKKEWKSWKWYEWVAQTGWLIILASIFYFGVHFIVDFYEHTQIDPNSGLGWFVTFLPLYLVAIVFAARAAYCTMIQGLILYYDL